MLPYHLWQQRQYWDRWTGKWALSNLHLVCVYKNRCQIQYWPVKGCLTSSSTFSMPVFCNWHKASQFLILSLGVTSDLLPPSCSLHCQLVSSNYERMKIYSVCHCIFTCRPECDILSCVEWWNTFVKMVHNVNHIVVVVFASQHHS